MIGPLLGAIPAMIVALTLAPDKIVADRDRDLRGADV